jgi:hypothetical protein
MSDMIPLRDALSALRAEVFGAAEDASTQAVRFELGPIEMEFQIVASREGGANGKIGFHIFGAEASIGASGKAASTSTQRVKLVLNPVLIDLAGKKSKLAIRRDRKG